jgi:hypothetical protein
MKTRVTVAGIIIAAVMCLGIAATAPAFQFDEQIDPAVQADGTATWNGKWRSFTGQQKGALKATITQSGTKLSGRMNILGLSCGDQKNLRLTGSISKNFVKVQVPFNCFGFAFTLHSEGTLYQNTFIGGGYYVTQGSEVQDGGSFNLLKK